MERINSLNSRDNRRKEFDREMSFREMLRDMKVPPHLRSEYTPKSNS